MKTEGEASMFENMRLTLVLGQTDDRPDAGTPEAPVTTQTGEPGVPGTATEPGAPTAKPGLGDMTLPLMLMLFLVLMFGMTWFSQRKEKKRRAQMLSEMKKNDRVITIGGVIGTVVEVKENEVVLKVDESSNTRMRFSRAAIQSVLGEAEV